MQHLLAQPAVRHHVASLMFAVMRCIYLITCSYNLTHFRFMCLQTVHAAVGKVLLPTSKDLYIIHPVPWPPADTKAKSASSRSQASDGGSNTGLIAGVCIAAVAAVAAAYLLRRRARMHKLHNGSTSTMQHQSPLHTEPASSARTPPLQLPQRSSTKDCAACNSGVRVGQEPSDGRGPATDCTLGARSANDQQICASSQLPVVAGSERGSTVSQATGMQPNPGNDTPLATPPAPPVAPELAHTTEVPPAPADESVVRQLRVAPIPAGAAAAHQSLPFTTTAPRTLQEPDTRSKVSTALYNMAETQPPVLFAGRFHLLQDQCHGGQAVVHFARDARGTLLQYAVKCASHHPFSSQLDSIQVEIDYNSSELAFQLQASTVMADLG